MLKKSFFENKRNVALTAVFYTFLWGSAFPLVKLCMEGFGIPEGDNMAKALVAGIRFILSGILTLLFCLKIEKNTEIKKKSAALHAILYGITGTSLQYAFTYIGLSRVAGSKGAIFDQICVFIIVLTSGLIFREDRLNLQKIIGCALGTFGVFAINVGGFDLGFSFMGEGMMLLAALMQTLAYFVAKSSARFVSAPLLVGLGQLIGGSLLFAFSLICGGRITEFSPKGVLTLAALVLISSVAYVLSIMPLKYFPASEISAFNLLITVFGVVMSALILGENIFRLNYLVSLVAVSLGILLINLHPKKISDKK